MPTFKPDQVPPSDNLSIFKGWLSNQLDRVATTLRRPAVLSIKFEVIAAEPAKIEEGDVVYADGTLWNPGAGRGLYEYRSGNWEKL